TLMAAAAGFPTTAPREGRWWRAAARQGRPFWRRLTSEKSDPFVDRVPAIAAGGDETIGDAGRAQSVAIEKPGPRADGGAAQSQPEAATAHADAHTICRDHELLGRGPDEGLSRPSFHLQNPPVRGADHVR